MLKTKYKEKPRLRLESRLWRGMRRIKCFGLPGVGTHLSVCVTVNWFDDSVLVQLEQMETCELIPVEIDEEYLIDLAEQVDSLEMVDGRYDLTINIFLRALVIKEAPKGSATNYVAELDETSGWASSDPRRGPRFDGRRPGGLPLWMMMMMTRRSPRTRTTGSRWGGGRYEAARAGIGGTRHGWHAMAGRLPLQASDSPTR